MIGSAENARFIFNWYFNFADNVEEYARNYDTPAFWYREYPTPDGWSFLGAGAHRLVYLGPDGVAYKIPRDLDDYCANEEEISVYDRIKNDELEYFGKRWRVAKMHRYVFTDLPSSEDYFNASVNAIEYIEGEPYECDSHTKECEENDGCEEQLYAESYFNYDDLHDGNVLIMKDGTRVIIDLGYVS
jgi:hypothetical protein